MTCLLIGISSGSDHEPDLFLGEPKAFQHSLRGHLGPPPPRDFCRAAQGVDIRAPHKDVPGVPVPDHQLGGGRRRVLVKRNDGDAKGAVLPGRHPDGYALGAAGGDDDHEAADPGQAEPLVDAVVVVNPDAALGLEVLQQRLRLQREADAFGDGHLCSATHGGLHGAPGTARVGEREGSFRPFRDHIAMAVEPEGELELGRSAGGEEIFGNRTHRLVDASCSHQRAVVDEPENLLNDVRKAGGLKGGRHGGQVNAERNEWTEVVSDVSRVTCRCREPQVMGVAEGSGGVSSSRTGDEIEERKCRKGACREG